MVDTLLAVGLVVAAFVGFNIGGSNTGVAFGPAVGSGTVSKVGAGLLMGIFALLGGWTVGRRVVTTLGSDLVVGDPFSATASVVVLLFIGFALFASNVFGVPASTSMTAVGGIAGLGLAAGELNWAVMGEIVTWWVVAPIIGFWVSGVIGRYFYAYLDRIVAMNRSEGPLVEIDRDGAVPRPSVHETTTRRELGGVGFGRRLRRRFLISLKGPRSSRYPRAVARSIRAYPDAVLPGTFGGSVHFSNHHSQVSPFRLGGAINRQPSGGTWRNL